MENIYILKDSLNRWVAKYFKKDLISVQELIETIEELDDEISNLKDKIEELESKHDNIDEQVDEQILMNRGV